MDLKVKAGYKSERGFQRELLEGYDGWAQGFHPSLGSKTGIPDTMFLYGSSMVPIELKIGEIVGSELRCKKIRPAQIRWAKEFRSHGGKSHFLCGIPNRRVWLPYLLPFDQVIEPSQKFDLSDCELIESYSHLFRVLLFTKVF